MAPELANAEVEGGAGAQGRVEEEERELLAIELAAEALLLEAGGPLEEGLESRRGCSPVL